MYLSPPLPPWIGFQPAIITLAGFFLPKELCCTACRQEKRLAALFGQKIHALELGREKTGKPASASIAGFFFERPKNDKKNPPELTRWAKSILWEGGGDRHNYSQSKPINKIPICNTYHAFCE
jgi:hypothetical protein